MDKLISEILVHCQNVQCGNKLAAEFSFIHKKNEVYDKIIEAIKHFPDLKHMFSPVDEQAAKNGWRNIYIYKYEGVDDLIREIESVKNKNSGLYHFALGKLFGYNDFEVISFIQKNCRKLPPDNIF